QPRADLRQLAADLRLHLIAQHGLAALLVKTDLGAALGEAGNAALTLAGNRIAGRRIEVGEGYLAGEGRLDRPDPGDDLGGELGVGDLLDGLAAGNADLQGFGVVEPLPHRLARGGDAALAMHFHRGCPRSGVAKVWAAIAAI